jgi:tRNA pseudouridine38-40 synthase
MARYCVELAYLGTNFAGWQSQPNANGVQEVVEKALTTLLKSKIEITGSSRTDAGVHVRQQFAHFDFDGEFQIQDTVYRLNSILPHAIAIKNILPKSPDFHARFDAKSRTYQYFISTKKNPFSIDQSYQFGTKLNLEAMNLACNKLFEHTDFQCFSKVHTDVGTFDCTIMQAQWLQKGEMLIFTIQANRFLRGMVRAIVGTLIEVGLQKISLDQFEAIILSKNRSNAGPAVPAKGLFLVEVAY